MFDEIGPESLVKSSGNVTANVIHGALYSSRPDVHAIVHVHSPGVLAVSCLEDGLMLLDQNAAHFVGGAG